MASAEEICPGYVGDERLTLELARPLEPPTAFRVVEVLVGYAEGTSCPIEFSVSGPTIAKNRSRIYRRRPPRSVSFIPREGGAHLVRVRELTHNRWYGQLVIDVIGETEQRPRRDEGDA